MTNKITTQGMRTWRAAAIALALGAIAGFAPASQAAAGEASSSANIVAAQGYDVVAYYFNDRPRRGMGELTHVHDGQVYLFINQTNQAAFKADPAKFAPAYRGYSAQGMVMGRKLPGDPRYWAIVGQRLYLNHDVDSHNEWTSDPESYIAFADTQWRFLRDDRISALTPKR
jgi:hypothetical protein